LLHLANHHIAVFISQQQRFPRSQVGNVPGAANSDRSSTRLPSGFRIPPRNGSWIASVSGQGRGIQCMAVQVFWPQMGRERPSRTSAAPQTSRFHGNQTPEKKPKEAPFAWVSIRFVCFPIPAQPTGPARPTPVHHVVEYRRAGAFQSGRQAIGAKSNPKQSRRQFLTNGHRDNRSPRALTGDLCPRVRIMSYFVAGRGGVINWSRYGDDGTGATGKRISRAGSGSARSGVAVSKSNPFASREKKQRAVPVLSQSSSCRDSWPMASGWRNFQPVQNTEAPQAPVP